MIKAMEKHQEDENQDLENEDKVGNKDLDGPYSKAGSEDMGALPNNPAENAKKTSPEEDAGEKEDTRLSAGNPD
jgi:hypothetical protein